MDLDPGQLRALAAAVSAGTFEAAASRLHVTPSAVSQRIRALEAATGRVLLVRTKPVRPTPSGEVVLRLARQVDHLTAEAVTELGASPVAPQVTVPLAINADSLGTWALPALAAIADGLVLEVHREDEAHTAGLLRSGTVVAAITTDSEPVAGCSVSRLGSMRYRPVASPELARRWFPGGLADAPVVVFDGKDDLQHRFLQSRVSGVAGPPTHQVPATAEFLTAVRLGLGWGMLPDLQCDELLATGELVAVEPEAFLDVTLYWQQWKLRSVSLDRVAAAIRAAARQHLR